MTNQAEVPPGALRFEQFEPLLGQPFEVPIGDERFILTLEEAKLLPHFIDGLHSRPPFSLIFKCPDLRILPQHVYAMDHPSLPGTELFLVPIAGDAQGISYQAIFN